VRKALVGSFLFHVALAISSFQWIASAHVTYPPRMVYEVKLVGAEASVGQASAAVQDTPPAPPAPPEMADTPDLVPAPTNQKPTPKLEEKERDIAAASNVRRTDAKPDSQVADTRVIRASVVSSGKDGRSAIDAPAGNHSAGEPGSGDIDNIEARGGAEGTAPLRLTHPEAYSETYVILHGAQPKYPEHERERGIEGRVTVELLIDANGFVARTNVLELVGPVSFQNSALDAVRQYEFQPPVENGVPSSMWIKFVITFQIHG